MEETNLQEETKLFGVSGGLPGSMTKANPGDNQPWREYLDEVLEILAKIPDLVGQFFADYQKPLITLGLFLGAIVTVKVTLAILDALNDIPLLAPLLELVGVGYTAWFVWRYLWKASNRQELTVEFEAIKKQILGDKA
jgi:hypothetical protein